MNIPSADVLLVPGLWLPGTVWAASAAALRERGHRPVALTLPGQGDGAADATLADQLAYVLTAIDAADHRTSGISVVRIALTNTRASQPGYVVRARNACQGAFLRAASPVM